MRKILTFSIVAAMTASAMPALAKAPALQPEERLAKLLDGRVAGKPVDCINLRSIQSSQIIDGTAIVYRVGKRLYVNRPQGGAYQLDRDDIIATRTIGSQLCRIDMVRLIDRTSHFPSGFVSLGEFVPYTKP